MSWTGVLREVRTMRFEEVYGRFQRGHLSCAEAADILGMSERSFLRYRTRYEAEGAEGLADRRVGRVSGRRIAADVATRVIELYATRYFDFNAKHFHEKLVSEHGYRLSYTWTKRVLQDAGQVRRAKKRGAHRRKRPRKPLPGMMLHQDGSRHHWVAETAWDLIVTMDDATSEIYSAFFVEEEGTMSTFQALGEVIGRHGLFGALYADRGSHYWITKTADQGIDEATPTQVKRALNQLGITLIAASAPEARGRSERMFATLQGRLPQELRAAGITTMAAANQYLSEVFLPAHNAAFRVSPAEPGTAFIPYIGRDLSDVLCVQEERIVGRDNCVSYRRLSLQIPPDRHRHHYVKAKVRVHEYPDRRLAVFHGPRCLARYNPDGRLIDEKDHAKTAA
jgi:transposase